MIKHLHFSTINIYNNNTNDNDIYDLEKFLNKKGETFKLNLFYFNLPQVHPPVNPHLEFKKEENESHQGICILCRLQMING